MVARCYAVISSTPGRLVMAAKGAYGPRGGKFWATISATYELSDSELELLVETCRLLDEIDALDAAVRVDGVTVLGSAGQVRVHPAVAEARSHRLALARLLAQLALPNEDGAVIPTGTALRARKAAQTRWAKTAAERGKFRNG